MRMRVCIGAWIAIGSMTPSAFSGDTASASDHSPDVVWVWNRECPAATTIALRVRLDGAVVFSTSAPICRWERRFEKGRASFRFTPARPLVWYAHRSDPGDGSEDPGETTSAGTEFEVEFWQAGGEPDLVLLGYSVAAGDGLHMNAVHFLSPTEKSATTMAPGLELETWPENAP